MCWRNWRPGHDLPRVLLDWRQLSKLKGTYTDDLIAAISERTGRVHTSFSLACDDHGRLSSSRSQPAEHPDPHRGGPQDPRRLRRRAGHVLICADYSQIELRLLAHIGDIPQLKRRSAKASTSTP